MAHVIFRLAVGGLENGLVNLINRMPPERYRHAIICLTSYTDFQYRLQREVPIFALNKREGKDIGLYVRLWQLLRQIRPDILHTRNLATLEAHLPGFLAGIPHRVHGEHGHDMHDLDNKSQKYRFLRRAYRPLVHRFIPLSQALNHYLAHDVVVAPSKLLTICNGVDTNHFSPVTDLIRERRQLLPRDFFNTTAPLIGTVGRLESVKDQLTLARAFVELVRMFPDEKNQPRLMMIGDGLLKKHINQILETANVQHLTWLPGSRDDVSACLQTFDIFVLPSLGEGISNTILEAMATGLPIIATDVGGNSELVRHDYNGFLVPRADPDTLAKQLYIYCTNPVLRQTHGQASRTRAVNEFSIDMMVTRYLALYDELMALC
ncbi:TIGR03088 family PEP-CTERM/XrtA system glycosyltransferase [Thiospirillum jenense]|uniref:TIGR03088 family PEP-CTERM/XrtA system glycosyltransferase n=1 Tax=Thiospirillum jenense TaxID=1653858 RepID=A0A839HF05_9GAMM|nr:TIGR03088 family PEP-CTERM/XrtA system glycosyltransferase [Thiospirillum jenense]